MNAEKSFSLRAILVLFALCIVLPATLAVGGLVTWNVVQVRRAQEAELLATARAASMLTDQRIARLAAISDAVATSDTVLAGDWARAERRIARFRLGQDAWVAVSDRSGRRLMNTSPAATATTSAARLPRPPGVRAALASGGPVVSDLFVGSSTGRQVVAIDRAVPASPEQVVVSIIAEPVALLPSLAELSLPSDGVVTITDRNHRVVARSRAHSRFQGVTATPGMIRAMRARPDGVTTGRALDGGPTVVAYVRSELTGWTTMVVVPRGTILRPILRNAVAFGLLSLCLLALGIALSRIFGNVLIRELRSLEDNAERLGHGQAVVARRGRIQNIERVQTALSEASTELRQRQSRQQLMLNELNHRVKNTLASVQGIAVQTFRHMDSDAPAKFDLRLVALAGAHDLLTQTSWEPVDIRAVIERCAEPAGGGVVWTGPSAMLPPHAALALCMCLHELVTNSLKYGALSANGGKVLVSWTLSGKGEIDFLWKEQGGPPVGDPGPRGFGSRLIDRLVKSELGGQVERDYRPDGLVLTGRFAPPETERWRNSFE